MIHTLVLHDNDGSTTTNFRMKMSSIDLEARKRKSLPSSSHILLIVTLFAMGVWVHFLNQVYMIDYQRYVATDLEKKQLMDTYLRKHQAAAIMKEGRNHHENRRHEDEANKST